MYPRNRSFVATVLGVMVVGLCVLSGCGRRPADLAGSWKDVSVDGAGALSSADKERLRYHLELKADGTGTFTTGGTPRNVTPSVEPTPHEIQWTLTGNQLVISDQEKHQATFKVSEDQKALSNNGTGSTFSKDVISFVKQGAE